VNRLGDFSPLGLLFIFEFFTSNVCAAYFHGKNYVLILNKNELGSMYTVGDFSTNSSGHRQMATLVCSQAHSMQGCQICPSSIYQNRKKYTK
jgi:hypothetical protein